MSDERVGAYRGEQCGVLAEESVPHGDRSQRFRKIDRFASFMADTAAGAPPAAGDGGDVADTAAEKTTVESGGENKDGDGDAPPANAANTQLDGVKEAGDEKGRGGRMDSFMAYANTSMANSFKAPPPRSSKTRSYDIDENDDAVIVDDDMSGLKTNVVVVKREAQAAKRPSFWDSIGFSFCSGSDRTEDDDA